MVETAFSDDYAFIELGGYEFYFGYEEESILVNGKWVKAPDDYEEDSDWSFVVKKKGKEIFRLSFTEIEDKLEEHSDLTYENCAEILAIGIAVFYKKP